MSESTLEVGSYVQNVKAPDWGIGKILELGNEGKRRVLFEYAGLKNMQPSNLNPVDPPENHPLLRSISAAASAPRRTWRRCLPPATTRRSANGRRGRW